MMVVCCAVLKKSRLRAYIPSVGVQSTDYVACVRVCNVHKLEILKAGVRITSIPVNQKKWHIRVAVRAPSISSFKGFYSRDGLGSFCLFHPYYRIIKSTPPRYEMSTGFEMFVVRLVVWLGWRPGAAAPSLGRPALLAIIAP